MRSGHLNPLVPAGLGLSAFFRDTRANISLLAALSAVVLTAGVGVGVDYARSTVQFDEMQAAVDAAALASANAANSGASTTSATQTADKVFALDFTPSPSCGTSGAGGGGTSTAPPGAPIPTVTIVTGSGVVTTTVSYQATMQTLFGGLIGAPCMTQSATATAQASAAASLYSEAGGLWGDPQIWGSHGEMQLDCGGDPGGWYNLLSDSSSRSTPRAYAGWTGADLNALAGFTVMPPDAVGEYYTGGVTLLIGSHVISFNTTLLPNNATNNPNNIYNGAGNVLSVWNGAITIDGETYTPNLSSPSSYLGGMILGQPFTTQWSASAASGQCPNGYVNGNIICNEMGADYSVLGLNAPYIYTIRAGAYEVQVYYRIDGGRLNMWPPTPGPVERREAPGATPSRDVGTTIPRTSSFPRRPTRPRNSTTRLRVHDPDQRASHRGHRPLNRSQP